MSDDQILETSWATTPWSARLSQWPLRLWKQWNNSCRNKRLSERIGAFLHYLRDILAVAGDESADLKRLEKMAILLSSRHRLWAQDRIKTHVILDEEKLSLLPGFSCFVFANHGRKWYNHAVREKLPEQIINLPKSITSRSNLLWNPGICICVRGWRVYGVFVLFC